MYLCVKYISAEIPSPHFAGYFPSLTHNGVAINHCGVRGATGPASFYLP